MTDTLAPYAMHDSHSRGRFFDQPTGADVRGIFARDRDRILHSSAFRRLKGKTQVFMSTQDDHNRTRLTHTLEVAQIARTLARTLRVNEDLTETIALAHDLGHPPYGHVGEDALQEFTQTYEGFDHNAQSLRIVCQLEQRYPTFDGLNLSWESIEGIIKHNGPFAGDNTPPAYIRHISTEQAVPLNTHATIEAQIAAISDDVAYNNHDIDDGLRSGFIRLCDLHDIPHVAIIIDDIRHQYPSIAEHRLVAESIRRLMTHMVIDIVRTSEQNIARIDPKTVDDVRQCGETIVCMSPQMVDKTEQIRDFLFEKVYRSAPMVVLRDQCYEKTLFLMRAYTENIHLLPDVDTPSQALDMTEKVRMVTDFVSGMTDAYADSCVQALKTLIYQNRTLNTV